jgi:hypothetical protein
MNASQRPDRRIAVLADIHGNCWALEAVLDDMARRGAAGGRARVVL